MKIHRRVRCYKKSGQCLGTSYEVTVNYTLIQQKEIGRGLLKKEEMAEEEEVVAQDKKHIIDALDGRLENQGIAGPLLGL